MKSHKGNTGLMKKRALKEIAMNVQYRHQGNSSFFGSNGHISFIEVIMRRSSLLEVGGEEDESTQLTG